MASVMELMATLSLDTSEFDNGLNGAKSKASTMGSTLMGGLKSAAKIGGAALGATTAAAGVFFKKSIDSGMQFDSAMSQVYATMGDNAQKTVEYNGQVISSAEALRDFAQRMGATTAFSATESADALNYMALAGYDAETSMKMLPSVLDLAAAGSMDLARASDMVTDAQTAYGLTQEETIAMVDQMAKTSSTTNTSVEQLGDGMLTLGATGRMLKGGTAELNQVLGILADNSIKGSEGGTHLRNILMRLAAPTDKAADFMGELGLEVFDTEGKMRSLQDIMHDLGEATKDMTEEEKTEYIAGIFNARDLSAVNALLGTTEDRWNEVATAIDGASGAADQMAATQLDNLSGDVTLFKSALEGVYIAISDLATPALRAFVQFGTNGLSELATALKEDGLAGAIPVFAEFVALGTQKLIESLPMFVEVGAQLLLAIVQGIIAAMPSLIESLSNLLGTAIAFVSDTLNANVPAIGGIFDQVVTLVGDAVELIKAIWAAWGDEITVVAMTAFGVITTVVSALLEVLSGVITVLTDFVTWLDSGSVGAEAFKTVLIAIIAAFTTYQAIMGAVTVAHYALEAAQKLVTIAQAAFNAVLNANPIAIVVSLIAGLVAAIIYLWNTNEGFREAVIAVWNALKDGVGNAVNAVKDTVTTVWNAIKDTVSDVVNGIKDTVTDIWNGITSTVGDAVNGAKDKISDGLNAAKDTVSSVLGGIRDKFTEIWDKVKETVSGAIDKIKGVMNFEWHLPHLSLPHISIEGHFSLSPPSVPHFAISWNKKALRNAYLLDDATIFGERKGTLLGGGEAGSEMIIGTGLLQGMIDESVKDAEVGDANADSKVLKEILMLLRRYVPELANMTLVTDTGALVGQLAPAMDAQLGVIARRRSYA